VTDASAQRIRPYRVRGDDDVGDSCVAFRAARSGHESGEAILEIGDEIPWILEADMQAQIRSRCFPARRGANAFRMRGNDQAFEPSPAPAHPEQPATNNATPAIQTNKEGLKFMIENAKNNHKKR